MAEQTRPPRNPVPTRFTHVWTLVDRAKPLQRRALGWGAVQLLPGDLASLDRQIASLKTEDKESDAIRRRPHIHDMFAVSSPEERFALLLFSARFRQDKLDELDKMCTPREFENLRKLVDDAKPFQKIPLRWGARELGKKNAAALDEAIAVHDNRYEKSDAICRREHLSRAFGLFTSDGQLALWWFTLTLPPAKLDELDRVIGRTETLLPAEVARAAQRSPSPDNTITWIPEDGMPHQVRRPH